MWTHCKETLASNASAFLRPSNGGGVPVEFDSSVNYTCERGMRFEDDFDLVAQSATCRLDNKWDRPAEWKNCVESKDGSIMHSAKFYHSDDNASKHA